MDDVILGGDSFAFVDATGVFYKYDISDTTFLQVSLSAVASPSGGKSLNMVNSAGGYGNLKRTFAASSKGFFGFNFWPTSVGSGPCQFLQVSVAGVVLASVAFTATGNLQVLKGGDPHQANAGTVLDTTVGLGPILVPGFGGAWIGFLEFAIDVAGGSYSLYLTPIGSSITQTLLTRSGITWGAATWDTINIRLQTGSWILSDYYIANGAGSINNAALGPVQLDAVQVLTETSAGWAPNTGTAVTACADIGTTPEPDGDATYIVPSGPGVNETFGIGTFSCFGLVLAAMPCVCARSVGGAADQQTAIITIDGGTQYQIGNFTLASSSVYATLQAVSELSPASGLNWTDGEISQSFWGVQSGATAPNQRVTQFWIEKMTTLAAVPFNCGQSSYVWSQ